MINGYHIEDFKAFKSRMNTWDSKVKKSIVICLKDNQKKAKLFNLLKNKFAIINAIHPDSTISPTSNLGMGIIVNAKAVIQPHSTIGQGCMIHAGVVIEHDCLIGDFVNLAPGVLLAGGVAIGSGTTVYTGSIVAPNVKIGNCCVIGAGSLVLEDIPNNVFAYGRPARVIEEKTE